MSPCEVLSPGPVYQVVLNLWELVHICRGSEFYRSYFTSGLSFVLHSLASSFQFQTPPLSTCLTAKSTMRPPSVGGCLKTTNLPITTYLNIEGGCKHEGPAFCWTDQSIRLWSLFPDLGGATCPRHRRMGRRAGAGGLQRGFTAPAQSCVSWTLRVCTPSEFGAAGTPCSAPTAQRSPSTHRLHLVSVWEGADSRTHHGGGSALTFRGVEHQRITRERCRFTLWNSGVWITKRE